MRYTIGWIVGVLVIGFGLTWLVQGNDFFLAKVFAPKEEALRRKTFEESKAYNDGIAQDLTNFQVSYATANPEQKKAIASIVMGRFANYDLTKLQSAQRDFVESCRQEQITSGGAQ